MIEDGSEMIEHAAEIVNADGDASLPTISVEAEGDGLDDQGPFPAPVGCAITGVAPVQFPLPESNPMTPEARTNASLKRESENATWQFPATRSTFPSSRVRISLDVPLKSAVFGDLSGRIRSPASISGHPPMGV